jgi:hypothetical protein
MGRFLPGHVKVGGRKKGSVSKGFKLSTIREFLEGEKWDPLRDVHGLMPTLSPYQQARINMELVAMEQRERLAGKFPGDAPKGEREEAERLKGLSTADFIAALPVKLDDPNGNGTHPGPKA